MTEGTIINYRRGRHTEHTNQYIISVAGIESAEAAQALVGKKVVWKTITGKELAGKVSKAHGNKGAVLAKFEKGLPGQALGGKVSVG